MKTITTEMFANHYGYSDINPYEIVKVISDKTLEIRSMNAERDESVKLEFDVGGFGGRCINQHEQKWIYSSRPESKTIRIRKKKHDDGVWGKGNLRFRISSTPKKYYDYNF